MCLHHVKGRVICPLEHVELMQYQRGLKPSPAVLTPGAGSTFTVSGGAPAGSGCSVPGGAVGNEKCSVSVRCLLSPISLLQTVANCWLASHRVPHAC